MSTAAQVVELPAPWAAGGRQELALRPLTGAEELDATSQEGAGRVLAAARILDALVEEVPGCATGSALDYPLPARDRLLAAVCSGAMGAAVELRQDCPGCDCALELRFSLDDLIASRGPQLDGVELSADGRIRAGGEQLVLPTSRDLLECSDPVELGSRCLGRELGTGELARVEELFERIAPRLDLRTESTCESCGASVSWSFEIGAHLLAALYRERPILIREIDVLARAYRWSLDEVLRLPRDVRQQLVALAQGGTGEES